jgi:hypothetical protein
MSDYIELSKVERMARKAHRCIWCGQLIPIGQKYLSESSVFDGNMQNHHWHLECIKDSDEFFKENGPEFDPY